MTEATISAGERASSPPLRVAYLLNSFHPLIGGAERHAAALAREEIRRGHQIAVLTRRRRGLAVHDHLGPIPIHRVSAGPFGALGFTTSGVMALFPERRRIDVVHAHQARSPALIGFVLRALGGPPLVVMLAGRDVPDLPRGIDPSTRSRLAVLRRADAVVALTPEMGERAAALGVPPHRLQVIPNGVDGERYRPAEEARRREEKSAIGIAADSLVVLYVGRLEPVKGPDLLLAAWRQIAAANAWLLIAGDGPERAALESEVGDSSRIRFLGRVEDPAPLYRAADIVVLPSRSEGMSNTLLEAMASGIAVIATGVPGNRAVVDDGVSGQLVDPDAAAITAALDRLIADRGERQRLGEAAARVVRSRYDMKTTADAYEALYRRLAAESRTCTRPATAAAMRP